MSKTQQWHDKTDITKVAWVGTARSGVRDCVLKLLADLGRDGAIDPRMRSIRLARDHWITGVGGGTNRHVQGDLAEKWHLQPLRLVARAAMAENVGLGTAMWALEIAHVL